MHFQAKNTSSTHLSNHTQISVFLRNFGMKKSHVENFKEWAASRYPNDNQIKEQNSSSTTQQPQQEEIITYDIKGNKIYPQFPSSSSSISPSPSPFISLPYNTNNINNNGNDLSIAQQRIIKAREENLALKRNIVQKNLQRNINSISYLQNDKPFISPRIINNDQSEISNNSQYSNSLQNQNIQNVSKQQQQPSHSQNQSQSISQQQQQHQQYRSMISEDEPKITAQQLNTKPSSSSSFDFNNFETKEQSQLPTNQKLNKPPSSLNENNVNNTIKKPITSNPTTTNTTTFFDNNSEAESLNNRTENNKPSDSMSNSNNNSSNSSNEASKNKEKKKLKKLKQMEQHNLLKQTITDMKRLSDHLNAAIDDNQKLLAGELSLYESKGLINENNLPHEDYEKKKKQKQEEKQKRQKLKIQMDSLLQGQLLNILPLWRHRLRGNINPKSEEILKGKSLFRVACIVVLYFYVKPQISILNRKSQTRSSEMDSLLKSILLFLDNSGHWIGKVVRLPISSIIQVFFISFLLHHYYYHYLKG